MTLTGAKPDKAFWLAAMRQEAAALRAAAASDGAFAAPVPSCPDWTVADLLGHTGRAFRWLAIHIVRGVTTAPNDQPAEVPANDKLLGWWDESLAAVLTALDRVDPDLPSWHWTPQAKVAGFWHRRFAHEVAVHRWDAQVAVGLPEPIDTALALDGVAEILDSWLPARPVQGLDEDGMVQLIASDSEESWLVRVRGEAVSLLDTATLLPEGHHVDVQATGSASDLELAMYGRVPFDVLEISGRESLLNALRAG